MEKYKIEAEKAGLTFIRKANQSDQLKSDYRSQILCRFNSCNHEQFIDFYKVKQGVFICRTCQQLKLKQETEDANLTFIRKADESYGKGYKNLNLYRFNACGHEQYISPTHVRKHQFVCRKCIENQYDLDAEAVGLTMIRVNPESGEPYPVKGGARLYQFNKCGHQKSIKMDDVRRNLFWCNECQRAKIESEASRVGLTFLRNAEPSDMKTEHKNHGFFRFNSCGHEQPISKTAVRNNVFRCGICNTGAKDRPSSVYLFKFVTPKFEWLKLGFSSDPDFRRKKYKLPHNCTTELLFELKLDTGVGALVTERELHRSLKDSRLCPNLMRNYMQESGFTECYPTKLEKQLLEELHKIKGFNGNKEK